MTPSQRAIEAAARANIAAEFGPDAERGFGYHFDELLQGFIKDFEEAAPGIAAALAVDGLCLVPVEPTSAMIEAGEETFVSGYSGTPVSTPHNVWTAMLAAANDGEERR